MIICRVSCLPQYLLSRPSLRSCCTMVWRWELNSCLFKMFNWNCRKGTLNWIVVTRDEACFYFRTSLAVGACRLHYRPQEIKTCIAWRQLWMNLMANICKRRGRGCRTKPRLYWHTYLLVRGFHPDCFFKKTLAWVYPPQIVENRSKNMRTVEAMHPKMSLCSRIVDILNSFCIKVGTGGT